MIQRLVKLPFSVRSVVGTVEGIVYGHNVGFSKGLSLLTIVGGSLATIVIVVDGTIVGSTEGIDCCWFT